MLVVTNCLVYDFVLFSLHSVFFILNHCSFAVSVSFEVVLLFLSSASCSMIFIATYRYFCIALFIFLFVFVTYRIYLYHAISCRNFKKILSLISPNHSTL